MFPQTKKALIQQSIEAAGYTGFKVVVDDARYLVAEILFPGKMKAHKLTAEIDATGENLSVSMH